MTCCSCLCRRSLLEPIWQPSLRIGCLDCRHCCRISGHRDPCLHVTALSDSILSCWHRFEARYVEISWRLPPNWRPLTRVDIGCWENWLSWISFSQVIVSISCDHQQSLTFNYQNFEKRSFGWILFQVLIPRIFLTDVNFLSRPIQLVPEATSI